MRERLTRFDGPHDVRLRAGTRNLGVCGNQNEAVELCSGELIVLFEGDDVSAPDRVARLVAEYQRLNHAVGALGSGIRLIRSDGTYKSTLVWPLTRADAWTMVRHEWAVHGCCMAFRRDCFSEVGPISRRLISGDNGLWLRGVFVRDGGLSLVSAPLVDYRQHETNVSSAFHIDYSSAAALRASCRRLRLHEVALLFELRKIRAYRKRLHLADAELDGAWQALWAEAHARAALVSVIARAGRVFWPAAAVRAWKFPALRRLALNALAYSTVPWARRLYRGLRGRRADMRIGG